MTSPNGSPARFGSWRDCRRTLLFAVCVVGCASAAPPPDASYTSPGEQRPALPKRTAKTSLWRDEVVWFVAQGLGRFLQLVDVEPSFESGRFQGFRIVALREARFWQGVDLKPGDVVLRVNARPIERETQAYDAFQSLKTAPELRVDYLREGERRAIVYKIMERPKQGG